MDAAHYSAEERIGVALCSLAPKLLGCQPHQTRSEENKRGWLRGRIQRNLVDREPLSVAGRNTELQGSNVRASEVPYPQEDGGIVMAAAAIPGQRERPEEVTIAIVGRNQAGESSKIILLDLGASRRKSRAETKGKWIVAEATKE